MRERPETHPARAGKSGKSVTQASAGRFAVGLAAILAGSIGSAAAQEADGCQKFKWSVAREAAAFSAPGLASVASGGALAGPAAVLLKLLPQVKADLPHPPGRPPRVDPAFAGVLELNQVAAPGTYQVTVSQDAWIDVWQNGHDIRSAGFSGQIGCPAIRKSVKFSLAQGAATIVISGAATDTLDIDILPAE